MGRGITTAKIVLIIYNILLALFCIGAIVFTALNPDQFDEAGYIGNYIFFAVCLLFAFITIFATIRENVCLMSTCSIFFLVLVLITFVIAITGIGDRKHSGVEVVNKAWETNTMDEIQRNHACCGKTSPNDYVLIDKPFPASCYLGQDPSGIHNLFTEGCSEKMLTYREEDSNMLTIFIWVFVAIELFGFVLASFLTLNFRNTQRRMQF